MEFLTDAWEWIRNLDPFLVCGILLLAIVGMFAYFLYSTLIMPWRVASTVSKIPMAKDLIIHREAIKKHATDMIDNYRNKDIDEMDLTDPDEIN